MSMISLYVFHSISSIKINKHLGNTIIVKNKLSSLKKYVYILLALWLFPNEVFIKMVSEWSFNYFHKLTLFKKQGYGKETEADCQSLLYF